MEQREKRACLGRVIPVRRRDRAARPGDNGSMRTAVQGGRRRLTLTDRDKATLQVLPVAEGTTFAGQCRRATAVARARLPRAVGKGT